MPHGAPGADGKASTQGAAPLNGIDAGGKSCYAGSRHPTPTHCLHPISASSALPCSPLLSPALPCSPLQRFRAFACHLAFLVAAIRGQGDGKLRLEGCAIRCPLTGNEPRGGELLLVLRYRGGNAQTNLIVAASNKGEHESVHEHPPALLWSTCSKPHRSGLCRHQMCLCSLHCSHPQPLSASAPTCALWFCRHGVQNSGGEAPEC